MAREDIQREILSLKGTSWLLELATGTGKSKMALEKVKSLSKSGETLLIVVPKVTLKKDWKNELNEWWKDCPLNITFVTYYSFPKLIGEWDFVIFDECHHLSERCREALRDYTIRYSVLCSATVGRNLKEEFRQIFPNLVSLKRDLRDVIEDEILPDPRVYLMPLLLRQDVPTESIWKNKNGREPVLECSWADRWNFIRQKEFKVRIYCTECQYLDDLNSQIDYWKKRYMATRNEAIKNKWLKLCGDRLKWLSDKKVPYVSQILQHLAGYRTLTFCSSIEQTEKLGRYCINSKNSNSEAHLDDFNEGKIDHITACNMLNEGKNLRNCQIGIYANLNSSETIVKQRMGRLLRHKNPVIIVPYFIGTREDELVKEMTKDYNPDLVSVVNTIPEIKI